MVNEAAPFRNPAFNPDALNPPNLQPEIPVATAPAPSAPLWTPTTPTIHASNAQHESSHHIPNASIYHGSSHNIPHAATPPTPLRMNGPPPTRVDYKFDRRGDYYFCSLKDAGVDSCCLAGILPCAIAYDTAKLAKLAHTNRNLTSRTYCIKYPVIPFTTSLLGVIMGTSVAAATGSIFGTLLYALVPCTTFAIKEESITTVPSHVNLPAYINIFCCNPCAASSMYTRIKGRQDNEISYWRPSYPCRANHE
jgi:hypothetical protein